MSNRAKPRVLVLGGGFGGLEMALSMRMRVPERADITIISDKDYFLYKPNTIYIPFGMAPEKLRFRLTRPAKRKNINLINARVDEVDPVSRHVYAGREKVQYDYLVVATGAAMRPADIPGLGEYGNPIWTPDDMLKLRASFHNLAAQAKDGKRQRVLFLIPPNNRCPGPLYEMVMMLDTWLRRKKVRGEVDISWSTFEESYIQAFGPRLHTMVTSEFGTRGIDGHTGYALDHVEPGEAVYRNGESTTFDLLVSSSPYVASTHFTNLPTDQRGFISTELKTRRVPGYPNVFAVGDAGDFPLKQAFLASVQADVAADHLSAEILGMEPKLLFDSMSLSVLEGFDKTTFARVPLRLTGEPDRPIEVSPDAEEGYRVGSSKAWKLGKMALGVYLPWRFKAGNPFHAGVPWKGMEAGLKLMSGMLAK